MFITESNNNKEIGNLLRSAKTLDCAVAFIGHGAEQYFKDKDVVRLICNLTSGSTNPYTIQKLQKMNIHVRNCLNLHAKVYLTSNCMIVSSSNLSANGLGLEDEEIKGWRECGVKIQDQNEIKKAKLWFNHLWSESEDVTKKMIDVAKQEWKKRRIARPKTTSKQNFVDLVLHKSVELKNREIYFAVTFEECSDEASIKIDELKTESHLIEAYEDWNELPENAILIDVFVGPYNGIQVTGIYKTPEKKKLITISPNKKEKLFICYKLNKIDNYQVSLRDIKSRLGGYLSSAIEQKCPTRKAKYFSVEYLMSLIN